MSLGKRRFKLHRKPCWAFSRAGHLSGFNTGFHTDGTILPRSFRAHPQSHNPLEINSLFPELNKPRDEHISELVSLFPDHQTQAHPVGSWQQPLRGGSITAALRDPAAPPALLGQTGTVQQESRWGPRGVWREDSEGGTGSAQQQDKRTQAEIDAQTAPPELEEEFLCGAVTVHWTDCPERVGSLPHWGHSRTAWTQPCALGWPWWSREVGLDDHCGLFQPDTSCELNFFGSMREPQGRQSEGQRCWEPVNVVLTVITWAHSQIVLLLSSSCVSHFKHQIT